MLKDSVSMIPFALLSGQVQCESGEMLEVRITELADDGFRFRTASDIEAGEFKKIELHFFKEREQCYDKIMILKPVLKVLEKDPFFHQYEVKVDDMKYQHAKQELVKQYYRYITLKIDGDDSGLSEEYTGYPAHLDNQITTDFTEQRQMWYQELKNTTNKNFQLPETVELSLALDNETLYRDYMNADIDTFSRNYWELHAFSDHWLNKCSVKRLYIGNEFCHNLFPDINLLIRMLEKAQQEELQVTVVFTYLREELISQVCDTLNQMYSWCQKMNFSLEVVMNDWGELALIQNKRDYLKPVLGILVNISIKDP